MFLNKKGREKEVMKMYTSYIKVANSIVILIAYLHLLERSLGKIILIKMKSVVFILQDFNLEQTKVNLANLGYQHNEKILNGIVNKGFLLKLHWKKVELSKTKIKLLRALCYVIPSNSVKYLFT